MLKGKRVLIVEQEFLIALDIQRILEGAHAGPCVFARTVEEARTLESRWSEFDLAITQLRREDPTAPGLARDLAAAKVPVVIIAADPYRGDNAAGLQAPVLLKPFGEDELLDACLSALR